MIQYDFLFNINLKHEVSKFIFFPDNPVYPVNFIRDIHVPFFVCVRLVSVLWHHFINLQILFHRNSDFTLRFRL